MDVILKIVSKLGVDFCRARSRQRLLTCAGFALIHRLWRQVSAIEYGTYTTVKARANMAHIRQSRPDSGLGLQIKVRKTFKGVPSSLGTTQTPMWGHSRFVLVLGASGSFLEPF